MIKPDRIVTTTCPYCGVGCNLKLHIKDDFIFKVTSPFDSPVNQGNLCVKGRFDYVFIYHPKRVTTPLARRYLLEGKPKPEGREQVFAVSTDGAPIPNSQISNLFFISWKTPFKSQPSNAVLNAAKLTYGHCAASI